MHTIKSRRQENKYRTADWQSWTSKHVTGRQTDTRLGMQLVTQRTLIEVLTGGGHMQTVSIQERTASVPCKWSSNDPKGIYS